MQARFTAAWQALGADAPPAALYQKLSAAYNDAARHYHTEKHLQDVLAKLDFARENVAASGHTFDVVELALWYHDIVYDAKAHDNEGKSRDAFLKDAALLNLPAGVAADVARLIDITARHGSAARLDEQIMCDCDLAILGAAPEDFAAYDRGIRLEYAHVPDAVYAAARAAVLARFTADPRLFKTPAFSAKYAAAAARNLAPKTP